MASAAAPSTPSGGVNTSMWASQPPSRSGWGRSGEPGSAFRGSARGRPGRGGSGRGGRGGRGGRVGGPNTPRVEDKPSKLNGDHKDLPKKEPSAPPLTSTSSVTSASDLSSSLPPKPSGRPKEVKPPVRKASESKPGPARKLPPIVVNPPPVASSDAPPSATTPNRSRRKRSQNKGSTSSVSSKKSPSTESSTSLLRAEKSPVIMKDLPPHLAPPPPPETPSFDIKHDIDALVERVRAVAMDRPHTPGSHIDWAGDDDDSLPDLDDWGVKSVSTTSSLPPPTSQPDLISPILAGALKPLPNLDFGSPQPSVAADLTVENVATPEGDHTPRGEPEIKAKAESAHPTKGSSQTKALVQSFFNGSAQNSDRAQAKGGLPKSPLNKSQPLHPSLPPKPAAAADLPVKQALPRKPVPALEDHTLEDGPTGGVASSMHASILSEGHNDSSSSKDTSPERQGLGASMHAPLSSSMSAPSHITAHTTTSTPSFHPTHGRAHTVGRPNGLRMPFSPSHGAFPDTERASHRDRINHARTHSSPPTGPGTSTARARAGSRPVITGAAMSQLMRTLNGAPPPKREAAAPAAAAPAAATKE
ncbi:hypothetical protein VTO73DRAFT_3418 [Trametes versicolor]